jgi:hypothetical protein
MNGWQKPIFGSIQLKTSFQAGFKWRVQGEMGKNMRDKETDVTVVGFGGAGASAAIETCDIGASVVLLEKSDREYFHKTTKRGENI